MSTCLINTLRCTECMNGFINERKIKLHLKRIANTCSGSRNKPKKKVSIIEKTIICPFCLNKPNVFFLPVRTYVYTKHNPKIANDSKTTIAQSPLYKIPKFKFVIEVYQTLHLLIYLLKSQSKTIHIYSCDNNNFISWEFTRSARAIP